MSKILTIHFVVAVLLVFFLIVVLFLTIGVLRIRVDLGAFE